MLGLLSTPNSQGAYTAVEKVTYTDGINGAVVVNALAGDDSVVLDDTATDDVRQRRQRQRPLPDRAALHQLHGDRPRVRDPRRQLLHQLAGWLTNGVSAAATINGGTGDDTFDVFRNKATLTLNGDAGDDTFVVRSFVAESEVTRVDAGEGRDFIRTRRNAPVAIDGGDGYDTVIVIGTEFADNYVMTADAVYGAGRFVSYVNVERLVVYGMEGNDTFYVQSTNPTVETSLFGGMGSDRVEVGGHGVPSSPTTCRATPGWCGTRWRARAASAPSGAASRSTASPPRSRTTTHPRSPWCPSAARWC